MKEECAGKGVAGMEREVLVSQGNAVHAIDLESNQVRQSAPLERAGALCVMYQSVFCASQGAIWRLDRASLTPRALFAGGPGMCDLQCSADGAYLYVLCAEADSLLKLDAKTGDMLLLNRAGVNPRHMAIGSDMLAVAGGEEGSVLLLDGRTLRIEACLYMPGPVYSVALDGKRVYALCLTPALSSLLVTVNPGKDRVLLPLPGMPGRLLPRGDVLLAGTQEALHIVSPDGGCCLGRCSAPGRPAWIADTGEGLLWLDSDSECLYDKHRNGWRLMGRNVCAAAIQRE